MTEKKETQLEAQDGKLRIHYEDESVTVLHKVETFNIRLDSDTREIIKVDYLARKKDTSFNVIKGKNYITNFKGSLENDGNVERATIMKEDWDSNYAYSYSNNKIVAVYFAGDLIHLQRPEEKEDN